ncbi:MAG TPA: FtsX-like permease family protein [Tepidisphaeraceae bacterium]|nr:FtsX-like permease family protein [Tepidisphaeraceae bacterium]
MFKLVFSNLIVHRVRTLLTALAIGLSCSLVIVVFSGYGSIIDGADAFLTRYMGSADAQITRPKNLADGPVPQSVADELARDPEVRRVTPRLEVFSNLYGSDGNHSRTYHVIGIRRPEDDRVNVLEIVKGGWFEQSDGNLAVVDEKAAESLKVDVGDTLFMPTGKDRVAMKVVGIIHKPEIFATASSSVYVPLETLQKFEGTPGELSIIFIDFNRGVDAGEFEQRWNARLDQIDAADHGAPPLKLSMVSQSRAEVESNLGAIRLGSYIGSGIAMLAGTFIIFSALAMGVTERQRSLAMLRAIGATRGQIAGMVIAEGMIVCLFGAICIGIPLGILWTHCLQWLFRGFIFFAMGAHVSYSGMALALAEAIASALAASLLPAWTASRTSPLEAMAPLAAPARQGPPIGWAILGLMLAALDPIIFHLPWENFVAQIDPGPSVSALTTLFRFYGHFCIGVEAIFFGFLLMAPMVIWTIEELLAPAAGRIFKLPGTLLRHQLSHGLWRSAGAAAALMCGLTLLIVMTTEGLSLFNGWRLPDKFPDIFLLSLRFDGLPPAQWAQLGQTPGISHFADGQPELMPIAVTAPGLGNNPMALVGEVLAPQLSSTLFFGVPPKLLFRMMRLDFRDNDGNSVPRDQQDAYAAEAERELELGRHIIVTEDYRQRNHVKYGDKVALYGGGEKHEYTICGIVWAPGLDVFVGLFDMGRVFDQRTAGMTFGSLDDAARDFGASKVNAFLANLVPGLDKTVLLDRIKKRMGDLNIKTGDVRQIKAEIDDSFRRLLRLLSVVAFSAMGVASLGVTNTIMASVRARRWHLGVLRSVGLCRGELMRMILAEAFLLGLAGMILGLLSGALLASDAHLLAGSVMGYYPPVVIPWFYISLGAGIVMIVSVVAAIWPAVSVARTEPLLLLQSSRAAT